MERSGRSGPFRCMLGGTATGWSRQKIFETDGDVAVREYRVGLRLTTRAGRLTDVKKITISGGALRATDANGNECSETRHRGIAKRASTLLYRGTTSSPPHRRLRLRT